MEAASSPFMYIHDCLLFPSATTVTCVQASIGYGKLWEISDPDALIVKVSLITFITKPESLKPLWIK